MQLMSPAFKHGTTIPAKYTCDGENINPPLLFEDVPPEAKSLVLIMYDPDVPKEISEDQCFDHWIVFNIPPTTKAIEEGKHVHGIRGRNSKGDAKYTGPCPPSQYQPHEHRYIFRLYALKNILNLAAGASRGEVEKAMNKNILQKAELMGRYQR